MVDDPRRAVDPQEPAPRVMLPWSVLGFPPTAATPTRIALRLMGLADLAHLLGGPVTCNGGFDDRDEPVPDGLFDERTFGALLRDGSGQVVLDDRSHLHPAKRPQSTRFGFALLPEPVASPWAEHVRQAAAPALKVLPVLPGAFRPTIKDGDHRLYADTTVLYARVLRRIAELRRLAELGAAEILLESGRTMLERAVRALVVEGADVYVDPESPDGEAVVDDPLERADREELGERPAYHYRSLLDQVRDGAVDFARAVDEEIARDPDLLRKKWPPRTHTWRVLLLAAGIEIVPLTDDGEVDVGRLTAARHMWTLLHSDDVHAQALGGAPTGYFAPAERADDVPWITVLKRRLEPSGEHLLITVGAAAWNQCAPAGLDCARLELVCRVLANVPGDAVDAITRAVWMAAAAPHRRRTFFAHGHTMTVDAPLVPGGTLAGFVFLRWDDEAAARMEDALPYAPQLLLAVGLTADELERARTGGLDQVMRLAAGQLEGRTDLFRRSV